MSPRMETLLLAVTHGVLGGTACYLVLRALGVN